MIKRWLGLWVISCHQSKRRKRFIKVIMGRELVSAFGILFIFPFGNNLYALLRWHIISLFQRAVIKHSKHFLGRTVGLYFCILFESLWAEPTLPPFFSRPRCRLPPGRDCTVDRDEWPVTSAAATQAKAGYQGTRGSLLLDWVTGGIVSAHLHQSWMNLWNKDKYCLTCENLTAENHFTSNVDNAYPACKVTLCSRLLSGSVDLTNKPVLCWLALSTLGVCFVERTHFNQKGSQSVLSHQDEWQRTISEHQAITRHIQDTL